MVINRQVVCPLKREVQLQRRACAFHASLSGPTPPSPCLQYASSATIRTIAVLTSVEYTPPRARARALALRAGQLPFFKHRQLSQGAQSDIIFLVVFYLVGRRLAAITRLLLLSYIGCTRYLLLLLLLLLMPLLLLLLLLQFSFLFFLLLIVAGTSVAAVALASVVVIALVLLEICCPDRSPKPQTTTPPVAFHLRIDDTISVWLVVLTTHMHPEIESVGGCFCAQHYPRPHFG